MRNNSRYHKVLPAQVWPRSVVLLLWGVAWPFVHSTTACGAGQVRFTKIVIDRAFRSEGVAVADINRDGSLDIVAGNVYYQGPNWKPVAMFGEPKEFVQKGYSDAFLCFADDLNGDEWPDVIAVGFPGGLTRWLENPGAQGGHWTEHNAVEKTGNESPWWGDVDGDGRQELVFGSQEGYAFARPGPDPAQLWSIEVIADAKDPRPGHGLGIGDVNRDGHNDVAIPEGWWEGPSGRTKPWVFHKAKLGGTAAQMCLDDFDGDGDADVLSSSAHAYGIWWSEQTPDGWTTHEIDKSVSQTHALHLADINRDGLTDFVTGKRYWAHNGNDPGSAEPSVLCWYELMIDNGRPQWTKHVVDNDSGVGLHAQVVDINGDGLLDIAASNKKGVHLFVQKADPVDAVRLFDGKTFAGWEGNRDFFRIQDGAIVGGNLSRAIPRNEFLCTAKEYKDFELRLKVRLLGDPARANAGIQIRSRRIPDHHEMIGYQADMGQHYWGCLYDESRRRAILAKPDPERLKKIVKTGDWNDYVIRCVGRRVQLWLNGEKTVDYVETDTSVEQVGLIGLQIHSGPPSEAWYKDITISKL